MLIPPQFNQLHVPDFAFGEVEAMIKTAKAEALAINDQARAKDLWISETIIKIHQYHRRAFQHLLQKAYYKAWCEFESIENYLSELKVHFIYDKRSYHLWHIEKSLYQFQILYPYRLFVAADVIKSKKICSTCNQEVQIHQLCEHEEGEIYKGEICKRISVNKEMTNTRMMDNPRHKYNVAFFRDEEQFENADAYDYRVIEEFVKQIKDPYQAWELEVEEKTRKPEAYAHLSRNQACRCGSGKAFMHCCMPKIGEKYPQYHCILKNSREFQKKSKFL